MTAAAHQSIRNARAKHPPSSRGPASKVKQPRSFKGNRTGKYNWLRAESLSLVSRIMAGKQPPISSYDWDDIAEEHNKENGKNRTGVSCRTKLYRLNHEYSQMNSLPNGDREGDELRDLVLQAVADIDQYSVVDIVGIPGSQSAVALSRRRNTHDVTEEEIAEARQASISPSTSSSSSSSSANTIGTVSSLSIMDPNASSSSSSSSSSSETVMVPAAQYIGDPDAKMDLDSNPSSSSSSSSSSSMVVSSGQHITAPDSDMNLRGEEKKSSVKREKSWGRNPRISSSVVADVLERLDRCEKSDKERYLRMDQRLDRSERNEKERALRMDQRLDRFERNERQRSLQIDQLVGLFHREQSGPRNAVSQYSPDFSRNWNEGGIPYNSSSSSSSWPSRSDYNSASDPQAQPFGSFSRAAPPMPSVQPLAGKPVVDPNDNFLLPGETKEEWFHRAVFMKN